MKKYFATILVVDDDENDRLLIERALRAAGVASPIYLASDGAEAIAYMVVHDDELWHGITWHVATSAGALEIINCFPAAASDVQVVVVAALAQRTFEEQYIVGVVLDQQDA